MGTALTAPTQRPRPASQRAVYRGSLPAVFQADDLCMRFTSALEEVLDPLLAIVDGLPSYFDPDLAPPDVLGLMARWLGVTLDETWSLEHKREVVRRAGRLVQLAGTRAGLELALEVAFPDLPFRVVESGGVVVADSIDALPPPPTPEFVVYCDAPLENPAPVVRLIDEMVPTHVPYRLKIKQVVGDDQ